MRAYFVYIVTNSNRTTLYVGVSNELARRISEHLAAAATGVGFTGKHKLHHLIYFEEFDNPTAAIAREKQIKKWSRAKKEALIATKNPNWRFLEFEI